jgi:hypothetical protein
MQMRGIPKFTLSCTGDSIANVNTHIYSPEDSTATPQNVLTLDFTLPLSHHLLYMNGKSLATIKFA